MMDVSISLPAKRRRGRPRKDGNLSREATLRSPENPTYIDNTTPHTATIYPTTDGLINNKTSKSDSIIGSMIYGVIEGSFDAGYIISVRISNNETPQRGVVFQPKKCVPITAAKDVAPQAKMYQRREITIPFSNNTSPSISSSGFGPRLPTTSKQTVLRPFSPYYTNQPSFKSIVKASSFPNMGCGEPTTPRDPTVGANQRSPPIHPTGEFQVHGNWPNQHSGRKVLLITNVRA